MTLSAILECALLDVDTRIRAPAPVVVPFVDDDVVITADEGYVKPTSTERKRAERQKARANPALWCVACTIRRRVDGDRCARRCCR